MTYKQVMRLPAKDRIFHRVYPGFSECLSIFDASADSALMDYWTFLEKEARQFEIANKLMPVELIDARSAVIRIFQERGQKVPKIRCVNGSMRTVDYYPIPA